MTRLTLEPLTSGAVKKLQQNGEPYFHVTHSLYVQWEIPGSAGSVRDVLDLNWKTLLPADPDAREYDEIQRRALDRIPGDLRALADQIEAQLAEADRPAPPEGA